MTDSLSRAVQVTVQLPPGHLWSSPFLQTLLGGLLAFCGGVLSPIIQRWLERKRLRRRLLSELDSLHELLTLLFPATAAGDVKQVLQIAQNIRASRDGFDRGREAVVELLDPVDRRRIVFWYENLATLTAAVEENARDAARAEASGHGAVLPGVVFKMCKDDVAMVRDQCVGVRDCVSRAGELRTRRDSTGHRSG